MAVNAVACRNLLPPAHHVPRVKPRCTANYCCLLACRQNMTTKPDTDAITALWSPLALQILGRASTRCSYTQRPRLGCTQQLVLEYTQPPVLECTQHPAIDRTAAASAHMPQHPVLKSTQHPVLDCAQHPVLSCTAAASTRMHSCSQAAGALSSPAAHLHKS
jgi:hypothetical protein